MSRWRTSARGALVALGAAAVLFSSLTMRTVLTEPDGAVLVAYGFPQPWHRPSLASSLEYRVDPSALALDLAVYVVLVALALALLPRALRAALVATPGPSRAALAVAVLPLALLALAIGVGREHFGGAGPGWSVVSRAPTFGLGALLGEPGDLRR